MNLEKETYEALARGYCSKDNELKTLDPDLIIEMADQVIIVVKRYAEEMCKKQREICASNTYPVLDQDLFRIMQDEVRSAPLATED